MLDVGPVALVLLCLLVMSAHARGALFSDWSTANNLGSPLNTPGVEMDPFISGDGLSLYFVAGRARGGFGGRDIWVSQRVALDQAWEAPQNLGTNVNGPFNENAPKLSPDGRTLYFQSDRPGFGGNDLYVSSRHRRRDDMGWEAAANLGDRINTTANEEAPFAVGSRTNERPLLYFASDRTGGLGDRDIYAVRLDEDEDDSDDDANDEESFQLPVLVEEFSSPWRDTNLLIRRDGLARIIHE